MIGRPLLAVVPQVKVMLLPSLFETWRLGTPWVAPYGEMDAPPEVWQRLALLQVVTVIVCDPTGRAPVVWVHDPDPQLKLPRAPLEVEYVTRWPPPACAAPTV